MELKIDKSRSNSYHAEVLAVMSDYKKLIDNPRQKIRGLTTQAIILIAISVVFLAIFSVLYIRDMSYTLYFFIVAIFALAFVLGIIYYMLIRRRISNLKDTDSDKKLIIEDDYVEIVIGDEKTRLAMSEIQYVLLNRYSICFLPKNPSLKLIAVDIDYRESVIQAIPDKSLIVDNFNLY